eukprot:TRINITY_DN21433_c0_g1_i1.p1 TRINITY_DN21433_c0_g1~~TRINITY_DN21433_c0_g1_i1.p1  ORF type:complete len:237 (+),score=7.95 TRINITY_DN21433_c0_g1_i1:157-867(+)
MVRLLRRLYGGVMSRTRLISDPGVRDMAARHLSTATWAAVVVSGLGTCGVDISPIIASVGLTGAAVAFASKDVLTNAIAGVMMAADRSFSHGDRIRIGTGQTAMEGIVIGWTARSLILRVSRSDTGTFGSQEGTDTHTLPWRVPSSTAAGDLVLRDAPEGSPTMDVMVPNATLQSSVIALMSRRFEFEGEAPTGSHAPRAAPTASTEARSERDEPSADTVQLDPAAPTAPRPHLRV